MKLGLIGFGEAGYKISSGLKEADLREIIAYDILYHDAASHETLKKRAEEIEIRLCLSPQAVLAECELILVAISRNVQGFFEEVSPFIKESHLFVDICVSSPGIKRQIGLLIEKKGALYVDAAVVGPVCLLRHTAPLIASGSGAKRFQELMTPYGMNITNYSTIPGEATTIKLVRSIFTKGYEALCLELLEVSIGLGITDLVLETVANTLDGSTFEQTLNRMVTGSAIHAKRQAEELSAAIELSLKTGTQPVMASAAKQKLIEFAEIYKPKKLISNRPEHWRQVVAEWTVADKQAGRRDKQYLLQATTE